MKCPSCNKVIKKTDKSCKYCGVDINPINEKIVTKTKIIYKNIESNINKWLILGIGILSFIVIIETSFLIWFCFIKEPEINTKYQIESYNYMLNLPFSIKNINEEFEFDDLNIKVSNKYELLKLENQYSIYNGRNVIKIPLIITNNSNHNHSLNLFYYDIFDEVGNVIDEVAGYYDESAYYAEDLKPGESYTKYIYALYYNNDYYSIRIKNKEKEILLKYPIKK